jgi:RNA polymerase sigma factor (sigma-70 family)
MASRLRPPAVLGCLRAALGPDAQGLADAELLARFAQDRDEGAFEILVWRHSGMVMRACRATLRDAHAAEDACQATFLALARQAAIAGRRGTVAGWLYRVGRRVAARVARMRYPVTVAFDLDQLPAADARPPLDGDLVRLLHEELDRLPERYRAPVLLCFFDGLSCDDAARRLGWRRGTVAGRLARARELLYRRLCARGVTLPLAALGTYLSPDPAAAVALSFVQATARVAAGFAAGAKCIPGVSNTVLELARGVTMSMSAMKLPLAAGVLVLSATVTLSVVWGAGPMPTNTGEAPMAKGAAGRLPGEAPTPVAVPAVPIPGAIPLKLDQPVELNQKDYLSVLSVHKGTFHLTKDSRLEATLKVGLFPQMTVDEWIYVAVFDGKGRLLGTASHKEALQYERPGRMVPVIAGERKLDFGISKEFKDAAFVVVTISVPNPPTPKN